MSYTTPPTFVADDILEADQLNILSDDIIDLDARALETEFMGVALLRTTAQSIANSTTTSISWGSAPTDIGGWWSSGTDIVVPAAAIPAGFTTIQVEIHGQSRAGVNGTGTRQITFLLNGTTLEASRSFSAINGEATSLDHLVWAEVAEGDVIVMQVRQNSGGALDYAFSALHLKRLGPLA